MAGETYLGLQIGQEVENGRFHLHHTQATCIQIKIAVFAGVAQLVMLLRQSLRATVDVRAAQANVGVIDIQINQYIGLGEALPHVGDVGMFLGRVACLVASRF